MPCYASDDNAIDVLCGRLTSAARQLLGTSSCDAKAVLDGTLTIFAKIECYVCDLTFALFAPARFCDYRGS